MRERLHGDGLVGVVGGDVLEGLNGGEGGLVLRGDRGERVSQGGERLGGVWDGRREEGTNLVVSEEPDSRGLVVLVVAGAL